jgi:hypothetical protein
LKTAHFLKSDKSTSQDLSLGALTYTTTYGRKFKLEQINVHFSQAVTETFTITLVSALGTNYNTILQSVALIAETDFVYRPQGEANFQAGDEIKIECTNANLTGICYAHIKTSEM